MASKIDRVQAQPDARKRGEQAGREIERLSGDIEAWREVRDGAVEQMLTEGVRPAEVSRVVGVTRSALAQRFTLEGTRRT